MPPIKPWLLKPKQSLRVFEGLGEVLDKKHGRELAEEQRQQTIEDRVFGSIRQAKQDIMDEEMHNLNKATIEKRLHAPPSLVKVTAPNGRVQFVNPHSPPPNLYERVPGEAASGSDATRMNARIRELVASGKPLAAANQQARSEFGFAPPRPRSDALAEVARREQAAAVRAGESKVGSMRREMKSVLARRPRQSQFVDPLTRMADTTAFNEAMPNWRADSTETAESLRAAQDELDGLKGGRATVPPPSPRAMGGGRAGGGNPQAQPARKPVSANDRAKAKTDTAFAAWLRANGYDIGPPSR